MDHFSFSCTTILNFKRLTAPSKLLRIGFQVHLTAKTPIIFDMGSLVQEHDSCPSSVTNTTVRAFEAQ
jgi:hypothetical protein